MRRPLLLSGFMASGKSTVGRRVAELARCRFEDLDARIEARAGSTIADIFAQRGESAFRELERAALDAVLGEGPAVVALGGGALLRREARLQAMDRGVVVCLHAPTAVLLERARTSDERPLLAGPRAAERAAALLEQRAPAYAEAHARFSTEQGDVDGVARQVLAFWRRDPVGVAAGERSYAVDIGAGITAALAPELRGDAPKLLYVSDQNVHRLHGAALLSGLGEGVARVVLEPGEQHKTTAAAEAIWDAALAHGLDRTGRLIGFGGGVVTDIAGFAAATWMRGINWAALPTTLLSMVDASVGGKTAVDRGPAKNAVGAFWQPSAVVCDTDYLRTEPERGFVSGLAEVVKSALIDDADLLGFLEEEADAIRARDAAALQRIVRASIAVKARVVGRDEREAGPRATLNLGHTVGHALEALEYGRLTHGEAVSLGLVAALRIGAARGITPAPLAARVEALLERLGLPVDIRGQPLARAGELLGHDKKRAGSSMRFVFARDVGDVFVQRVALDELKSAVVALS